MNRWALVLTILVAGSTTSSVRAQASLKAPIAAPEQIYSLEELTRLADEYNPILRRDQAIVEAARGNAVQASLYPNPHFDTNNPQVLNGRNTLLNVGFQQEIVVKGKLQLDTAAANKVVRQTQVVLFQDRFSMFGAVRAQFFHVLAGQKRVQVLTELQGIVTKGLETGKKLEKIREQAQIDTLLLTIDLQKVQADLLKAQSILDGDRKELAAIVGLPSLRFASVAGNLEAPLPDFEEQVIRRFVAEQHTQIQLARLEVERNRILHKRAQVEPYPNFTMGPAYQYGLTPGNDQFWFNVTFPIPVWDRNQGAIRAADANIRNATENLGSIQNELLRQTADVLSQHLAARRRVEKYKNEIMPNTLLTLKLAQAGYAKQVFDFARYLQAQRTVVETYKDYIDALEDFWTTAAQLSALLQKEQFP